MKAAFVQAVVGCMLTLHRAVNTAVMHELIKRDFILSECLNCTKFDQLIRSKRIKIVATRCHYFKAKMHQIRFQLDAWALSQTHWGSSLQRSPARPHSWI